MNDSLQMFLYYSCNTGLSMCPHRAPLGASSAAPMGCLVVVTDLGEVVLGGGFCCCFFVCVFFVCVVLGSFVCFGFFFTFSLRQETIEC